MSRKRRSCQPLAQSKVDPATIPSSQRTAGRGTSRASGAAMASRGGYEIGDVAEAPGLGVEVQGQAQPVQEVGSRAVLADEVGQLLHPGGVPVPPAEVHRPHGVAQHEQLTGVPGQGGDAGDGAERRAVRERRAQPAGGAQPAHQQDGRADDQDEGQGGVLRRQSQSGGAPRDPQPGPAPGLVPDQHPGDGDQPEEDGEEVDVGAGGEERDEGGGGESGRSPDGRPAPHQAGAEGVGQAGGQAPGDGVNQLGRAFARSGQPEREEQLPEGGQVGREVVWQVDDPPGLEEGAWRHQVVEQAVVVGRRGQVLDEHGACGDQQRDQQGDRQPGRARPPRVRPGLRPQDPPPAGRKRRGRPGAPPAPAKRNARAGSRASRASARGVTSTTEGKNSPARPSSV